MTWVIGFPTMFGYSIGLADIQATITFSNGQKQYFDCVQKIYPVGKFVVAGFSGVIETGFLLMEDLKKWAVLPEPGVAWIPDCLVIKWRRRARKIYSLLPKNKQGPVSILLFGVYPQRDNGIPGESQTYGCIMEAPDFEPKKIPSGKIGSIGSGNNITEYIEKINNINKDVYNPLMQMEVGNPGGYGQALSSYLSITVNNSPVKGISNHFHISVARRGEITLGNNNYSIYPVTGPKIDIKMPVVATSWNEFKKIMKQSNIDLSCAEAVA